MRLLLLTTLLVACARQSTPAPQAPAQPCPEPAAPAPVATAPVDVQAPDLDDKGITERSHAYFAALDRFDADTVAGLLAPGFANYSEARFGNADILVGQLRTMAEQKAPARTRTWTDEHVFRSGQVATFIGEGTVHFSAFGDVPEHDTTGYFTLVWTRGERWTVALSQWDRHDKNAEKDRWNDWLVTGQFNRKPNQTLIDAVKGKRPGKALDIGMGQGRNAIFLASQGWRTTGVDFAAEGIKIAKETAKKQKLKLETVEADVNTWDFGTNRWDLVTLIYAGADPTEVERIKKSLKKGGLFVAEYFHVETEEAKHTGAGGFMTGELAAAFKDGYKILRDDVVEDKPDWGMKAKMKIVRFVAQKL